MATTKAPPALPRTVGRSSGDDGAVRVTPATTRLEAEERAALGAAARARVPLEAHADYRPAPARPDPVDVLVHQAASRVPELVPIRYSRMLVSPFTFYRGAAAVMAGDLATTPASGLRSQVCGDAHLSNFGVFRSPERRLVFDLNDFDETYPGPWEWDVKRLTASLVVAGRENGFDRKARRKVVRSTVAAYRESMAEFAAMRELDVWYAHADIDEVAEKLTAQLSKARRKRFGKNRAKARGADSLQAMSKLTAVVDGHRRIVGDPPLIVPVGDLLPDVGREELEARMRDLLDSYGRSLQPDRRRLLSSYEYVDMARKVVGVGSVGTRCWIVLLRGRDDGDPLLLQVKEAQRSVLADHVRGAGAAARHRSAGQRVVSGQRLMQAVGDILLGWVSAVGIDGERRDFYVRQLRDWKGSAIVDDMEPATMRAYGRLCGWTLARAHARSVDRIAIAAYLGDDATFDRALVEFSERYADQNESDHAALAEAVRSGRVTSSDARERELEAAPAGP